MVNIDLSTKAKNQITAQKDALVDYFTKASGEEVFGSAYTILVYQRVYDLLMNDEEFQTDEVMNYIINDDPPMVGHLTSYCIEHNVLDLDKIRDLCLDCIRLMSNK